MDDDEWLAALIKLISKYADRVSLEVDPRLAARLCYLAGMESGLSSAINVPDVEAMRHLQGMLQAFLRSIEEEVGQGSDSPLDWPVLAAGPGRIKE